MLRSLVLPKPAAKALLALALFAGAPLCASEPAQAPAALQVPADLEAWEAALVQARSRLWEVEDQLAQGGQDEAGQERLQARRSQFAARCARLQAIVDRLRAGQADHT